MNKSLRPQCVAHLVSTSASDDAAYVALHDLARILLAHKGTRVIGGHMVSLIAAAFPSAGFVERRTNDADAGIPIHIASTGMIHAELVAFGYEAVSGNHYERIVGPEPHPAIDLLIPSHSDKFGPAVVGGRAFDATPGLGLVVDNENGIDIEANMTLRNGLVLQAAVTVPTIETAFIVKCFAWKDRHTHTLKDAIDIWNLLAVLDEHDASSLGGWTLQGSQRLGSRGRAQVIAGEIAMWCDGGKLVSASGVDSRRLAVLIRKHVALSAPL